MVSQNDELACVYASLILADDKVTITSDKINTILKAAGYEVEPYWPGLFANALESVKVSDLISNVGSGSGAGVAAGAAPLAAKGGATAPAATAASAKKEEPKKEEKKKEESDDDMGFGLFD